jgi:RNA 3'-terminal phosphate cyclase (ATP)
VEGAVLGSTEVTFRPGPVRAGSYRFSTEGAGSATLVLQTVLPPLLRAGGPSWVELEGGTHNPFAPPFDFLARTFVPVIERMGPRVELSLERPGFFPGGGGRFIAEVHPGALRPLELLERGPVLRRRARAFVSALPTHVAERELSTVASLLGLEEPDLELVEVSHPLGPGNAVVVEMESRNVTEVFTGFGRRGVPAEVVASACADEARAYEAAEVPVGRHLADQLLVPVALAGGGRFRTMEPTLHTRTNAGVVARFLDIDIRLDAEGRGPAWRIEVG